MQWLEIWIDTTGEEITHLCQRLECLGVTGMAIEDEHDLKSFLDNYAEYWDYVDEELLKAFEGKHRVKFYLEDSPAGRDEFRRLETALGIRLNARTIKDEDWATNWKQYYRPMNIGESLTILPSWEQEPAGTRVVVRLDPGLIFGTGSHPTTRMCLEMLEKHIFSGARVLDLGCGSGILAIASARLGANKVVGCDIDELAPKIAMENAALNGIGEDRFKVYHGDILTDSDLIETIGGQSYEIILLNIVADVIISLAPTALKWLAEKGRLICSGIIEGRQQEVGQALEAAGYEILEKISDGGWHGFICRALR